MIKNYYVRNVEGVIDLERWRRNLYLLWIGNFTVQAGFSLVMPFLPYYVASLGVGDEKAVQMWSGLIFAANFVTMAIFSPIWGAAADRTGRRRQMLRSGFGMAGVVALMGLVTSPWQLLGLRLLQGVASGFVPAAVAFAAANTPVESTGFALGLLQTGGAAGSIVGPLLGGVLAKTLGSYRPIFFLTALACVVAATLVLFLLREDFTPPARSRKQSFLGDLRETAANQMVFAMSVVYFINFFAIMTAEPILSLFLRKLDIPTHWVDLAAGIIFSSSGVANVITAPFLGRHGDRIGFRRILIACLSASAVLYALQAFVTAAWQLLILRFLLGACLGGIFPSANALVARSAGRELQGRAFGLTNTAVFIGNFLGPIVGGAVASAWNQRAVFGVTALAIVVNLVWIYRMVPADRPTGAAATTAACS